VPQVRIIIGGNFWEFTNKSNETPKWIDVLDSMLAKDEELNSGLQLQEDARNRIMIFN
jgi:hypothetical protein